MKENLTKIIHEQDKILYLESLKCKEANCLRSSYIIFWICIAESLKRKIEYMANLEEKSAISKWELIERQEKDLKSVDKIILESAKELNLISDIEFQLLSFHWSRRCIFAHPYNTEPTILEIDAFHEAGINNILNKEIQLGKESISKWISDLSTIPHFLPNDELRNKELILGYLIRIKDNLRFFTFKTLFFNFSIEYDKDPNSIYTLRLHRIINLFTEIFPDIFQNDEIGIIDHLSKFPEKTLICYIKSSLVPKISNRAKELLEDYILIILNDKSSLKHHILIKIGELLSTSSLSNIKTQEIIKITESYDFQYSILLAYTNEQKVKLIEKEIDSGYYHRQDTIIQYLKSPSGVNLIKNLEESKLINLGQKITWAATWNSFASQNYIYLISSNIEAQPLSYICGMIKGLFFKNGEFRWDQASYNYVKILISKIDIQKLEIILDIIIPSDEERTFNEGEKEVYLQDINSHYLISEIKYLGTEKYQLIYNYLEKSL